MERKTKCPECDKEFQSPTLWATHIMEVHFKKFVGDPIDHWLNVACISTWEDADTWYHAFMLGVNPHEKR